MLLLGIDLGTSSVKVSVVDSVTLQCIASARFPDSEAPILSAKPGWAEQSPSDWWYYVNQAILQLHAGKTYNPHDISAIGIAYQMHGLVAVDKQKQVLRNSIIWCDSRAVSIGDEAFHAIGKQKCLTHLLNSPGNFTASKLAWVKQNEPSVYEKIDKIMLPGDFISMKFTGEITTTISALSEAVCWDFINKELSRDIFDHYGIDTGFVPALKNVFAGHGQLTAEAAAALSLKPGIPVTYKAGDQLNNALSLGVLNPGQVAASAGTSGVIFGVTDIEGYDEESRVNNFAHVNYDPLSLTRIGVLLCINGTGIMNKWIKEITGNIFSYAQMNEMAATVEPGSRGLLILPFGNGAERMLNNKTPGAHLLNIDLNIHNNACLFRAVQESIVFSFRYGLDIMRSNNLQPAVIRAGRTNMFLSSVFRRAFVNCLGVPLELYETDGSTGAAVGAGIGAGIFSSAKEALASLKPVERIEPSTSAYEEFYRHWLSALKKFLD